MTVPCSSSWRWRSRLLSLPTSALDLGAWGFTTLMVVVGCGMGIGKASVFKYVPDYFPSDVGAVGGLVGMLGALGGFILPPVFGRSGGGPGRRKRRSSLFSYSPSQVWDG